MSEEQPRRRRRVARAPVVDATETVTDAEVERAAVATAVPTVAVPTTGAAGLLHRVKVDPAVGLGIFVPGLFVMALGGAMTWHWIFNLGEGVMLLGMTYFVGAVIVTALQQRAMRKAVAAGDTVVTKRQPAALPDAPTAAGT